MALSGDGSAIRSRSAWARACAWSVWVAVALGVFACLTGCSLPWQGDSDVESMADEKHEVYVPVVVEESESADTMSVDC